MRTWRKLSTLAAAATLAGGLVLAGTPAAAAEERAPRKNAAATAYAAENSGCNGWACVKIVGSGGRVDQIQAYTNFWAVLSFYGHFRIFGPDFAYNTPDRNNSHTLIHYRNIGRSYANGSKFCVEAYQKNSDGSYTRRGLPCVYTPIS
ncbi:hypothetical protein ACFFMN_25475 [Planobispora siamensis]|uniref:Peptidase inhibitor family I36 n=1 Tax=Planobispora siamensis TaxID=936338 RepID=A0A8J3SKS7_9ACTN|nr:hypothetical protein [Planobispora siamensis]GIH94149.1 hypothetical protein Psi01_47790 [Planobispora siamensis]